MKTMVAVAYERCPFTRASNYKALTEKILMFWIVWSLMGSTVYRYERYMVYLTIFKVF